MSHKNKKHGLREHRVYAIWRSIKIRCKIKTTRSYKYYGAKGVTYCDEWEDFINFIEDMGLPPSERHSIERIDPFGNYNKMNCKWIDLSLQQRNKRNSKYIDWKGKQLTLTEIARMENLCPDKLRDHHIRRGRTLPDAITHIRKREANKILPGDEHDKR